MQIVFSIVLLITVLSLFIEALNLKLFLPNGAFASGFFPISVSIVIMVLIIPSLRLHNFKLRAIKAKLSSTKEALKMQVLLIVSLFTSILLTKYLGMLISLGLFLLITSVVIERLTWKRSFIFSVASIVCIYLIFQVWLNFELPRGVFFE